MYIIYIKNYKRRIAIASIITSLWLIIFLVISLLLKNNFFVNVTVDNYLNFSCPLEYEIENIYINKNIKDISIEASNNLSKPIAENFSTYQTLKGGLSFKYPSVFELKEMDFQDSEVLYHISFINKTKNIHGFIQTWNLPYELESFLKNSISLSQGNDTDVLQNPITVNNLPGFYLSYTVDTSEGQKFKASEVFLKKNNKMYRLSYFAPLDLWDKKESEIFWHMVNSFKVLE
ncbi:MAG TPA: hypothetical protein GX727_01485 [Clostridium sp.]|nr:hypothetical protein [Clostridium sp.]